MKIRDFFVKITATFFYVGFLPFIPGTFGSLAGLILYYCLNNNNPAYLAAIFLLVVLGLFVCGRAEKIFGKKDPRYVVIDEVAGLLIALLFLPLSPWIVITGFLVFRLLDTLKPFPANRLERLHGSLGIMGDDIVAGIYTNIVLQVALRLVSYRGW